MATGDINEMVEKLLKNKAIEPPSYLRLRRKRYRGGERIQMLGIYIHSKGNHLTQLAKKKGNEGFNIV